MPFAPWYPLAEAADHIPSGPGVFQVRLRAGLRDYPRGKSAMVHYGVAPDLRAAAAAFAASYRGRDWLCRHAVPRPASEAEARQLHERLIAGFCQRFGLPPTPAGEDR